MTGGTALRWRERPAAQRWRWRGPDGVVQDCGSGAGPMAMAAIVGAPGAAVGESLGSFTSAMTLPAGAPVIVSRINGQIYPADAARFATAGVIGTIQAAVVAGFAVEVARGPQKLADWSAVAGSAALLAGQLYFLGAGGGITTVVPSLPAAAALAVVGTALTASVLDVSPLPPIQF